MHGHAADDTCVINQDVNRSYFFSDGGNHFLNCGLIGHVTYISVNFDAFFSVCGDTFVNELLVDVVKTDFCALFSKC